MGDPRCDPRATLFVQEWVPEALFGPSLVRAQLHLNAAHLVRGASVETSRWGVQRLVGLSGIISRWQQDDLACSDELLQTLSGTLSQIASSLEQLQANSNAVGAADKEVAGIAVALGTQLRE